MNRTDFSATATRLVQAFGTTAHSAIEAWRVGGERLGQFADTRWDSAFEQASPRLSAETRRNAQHARKVIGGYYRRGIALSSGGAGIAVDTVVQAGTAAIARARARRGNAA